MMRAIQLAMACGAVLVATAGQVQAGIISFIPPNEPVGMVFTTNANDAYDVGRGIVFKMQGDVQIDSIGIRHDLTGVNLSYEIAEVSSTSGVVTASQTILRSGSSSATTMGLEWIDFGISPLTLMSGKNYHIEFTHAGTGNQNFFYQNNDVTFTEGDFTLVEGTSNGNTSNFVMPAIRVNAIQLSAVPEPSSLAMFGIGVCGMGFGGRRRRRQKNHTTAA